MNHYLLAALVAVSSFIANAGTQTLFRTENVEVTQIVDEFSGNITLCQLAIGNSQEGQRVELNIFAEPKSDINNMSVSVQNGSVLASAYRFFVDTNRQYRRGLRGPRDHVVFGHFDSAGLTELRAGGTIVIQNFPVDLDDDPTLAVYKLTHMNEAIDGFQSCMK